MWLVNFFVPTDISLRRAYYIGIPILLMLVLSFLYLNDHHRVEIAIACLVVTFAAKPLSRVKDVSWILGVLVAFALITLGVLNNLKPMLPQNITGLGSAIFVILGVWVGLTTFSSILKQGTSA